MDYYSRLGVNKSASPEELKRAYKKLAMQHHPDRGGDQKTFQEINEAYDTLKDPAKRQQYDAPKQTSYSNRQEMNMNDFFNMFGQRSVKNSDVKVRINLTLEEVMQGKDLIASYRLRNGQQIDANIRIHAGVEDGEVIRYGGLGDNAYTQLPRGDLLVQVRTMSHRHFKREGAHLHTTADVNIFDLILGTEIVIEKLTGGPLNVKIPKGTDPGTVLSVHGYGLPSNRRGRPGNLYVKIKAKTPKIVNQSILEKVKDLNDEIDRST